MPDGSRVRLRLPARAPRARSGHDRWARPLHEPASVSPHGAPDGALLIGVEAPHAVRARRLARRSPDLVARGEEAVRALLAHDDPRMIENVDIVVRNHGSHEATAPERLATAVTRPLVAAGPAEGPG